MPAFRPPLSRCRSRSSVPVPLLLALLAAPAAAQGPAFESPGQPPPSTLGQTTRFSNELNPALGFALDGFLDWTDAGEGDDGFDLSVRLLELSAAAYVDPKAWAYAVIAADDLEELSVEEAAVEYVGFEGNSTFRAGRFFVDFGKQMQMHPEELRTLERPLVLREYLGDELAGTGLQWDTWTPLGDTTVVRFSLGAFASLLGESGAEDDEDEEDAPSASVPDRKDFDDFSLTARLTGMRDAGEGGVLQLGTSLRVVPEFAFAFDDLEEDGLSSTVYGADLTYGWKDETGVRAVTVGGEALLFTGDLAAAVDDPLSPTAIDVVDDHAFGYYAFADCGFDEQNSAGVQYSAADLPEDPSADAGELDLYYTRRFTELRRLRLGVTLGDGLADDARAYVQFTNFFGSHAHGLNW